MERTIRRRKINYSIDKSLLTNIVSLIFLFVGFYSQQKQIFHIGIFALSGAITNWLAIYMLFEKVPGLYGSGVIPSRFEEFKEGIYKLIMNEFFTQENINKFLRKNLQEKSFHLDLKPVLENVDYHTVFEKLIQVIENSKLGGMLNMFGGAKILTPLEKPFTDKMKETLSQIIGNKEVKKIFNEVASKNIEENIIPKIESIVKTRLDELTPKMVKEIIQEMIRKHLGWLVVWGGVFGGFIGLITALIV